MNLLAAVLFLLIGFLFDWSDAFCFGGGYLTAFLVAGWMKHRGQL